MPFGALIAGALGGAALGAGQSGVNYALNRELQKRQFEFQERMSSTAYQRARKDLEAAGLNPMLAYMGGGRGASTPSGGVASVGRGESWAQSGRQLAMYNQEMKNLRQQEKMMSAQAARNVAAAGLDDDRSWLTVQQNEVLKADVDRIRASAREREALAKIQEQNVVGAKAIADLWRGDFTGIAMSAKQLGMSPAELIKIIGVLPLGKVGRAAGRVTGVTKGTRATPEGGKERVWKRDQ